MALAAAGALVETNPLQADDASEAAASRAKIGVFTKSFQDRSIPEVCRIFKEMGLDGLDLTVRRGGHIDPADVEEKLPAAKQAAVEAGVEILFLTTGITDADADAERLIATAAELGINKIKMGYYRYESFGTLAKQMTAVQKRMESVVQLASKYHVLPCVHIHSGAFIPSHGTMLYQLINQFSPDEIGAYVDPLHMTMEGSKDGWRQGLDLLAPWIALCSVKNFRWEPGPRGKQGEVVWKTRNVPLADGICSIPKFTQALKQLGFEGPYSLHSEYKASHSFKRLDTEGCIRQTAEDFKFFRPLV